MTDGWAAYTALGGEDFKHQVVNHKRGFREQERGNEHVCHHIAHRQWNLT